MTKRKRCKWSDSCPRKPAKGKTQCEFHLAKKRATNREWYRTNLTSWRPRGEGAVTPVYGPRLPQCLNCLGDTHTTAACTHVGPLPQCACGLRGFHTCSRDVVATRGLGVWSW